MARCSSVCGMMPSFAETTRSTKSIPIAPETILRMNFSCPGVSIIAIFFPDESKIEAKPKVMLIPLSFSSFSLSVSQPHKAFTRAVFP